MTLRRRLDRLELPGPSPAAIRAAMVQLRETGLAPDGPAGELAQQLEKFLEMARASVPEPPA